jgi:propanediol dehydratase small subunit
MITRGQFGALLTIIVIALLIFLPTWMRRRRSLGLYWTGGCMGIRWRRRFPGSSKAEIREFLAIFVDAFGFGRKRCTSFSPDDRVMEVYRAENPPGTLADNMELETLGLMLEKRYGIDFDAVWREDMTLGELYERTRTRTA